MGTLEMREIPSCGPLPAETHASGVYSHQVRFYRDEYVLVRSVAEHLTASMNRAGGAIAIATRSHLDLIRDELRRLGHSAQQLERCLVLDAEECLSAFMDGNYPDPVRFNAVLSALVERLKKLSHGELPSISAFGEMVAVMMEQGKPEAAVQLEQLWTRFIRQNSLSLLCAYPLTQFSNSSDRELFARICAEHSSVIPVEERFLQSSADAQARQMAELQQRAAALENEVEARRLAERKLLAAHAELESIIEERTSALRKMTLHILRLQDVERRRIARELHDSVGQDFVGLKMNLDLLRRSPDYPELWRDCDQLLERCIHSVRTLSYLLHPPMIEDAGFGPAAAWYVHDFTQRTGVKVDLDTSSDLAVLPERVKLVLFRVLQESLMNVYRHAGARHCQVNCGRHDNHVVLEIKDNGSGIPEKRLTKFNLTGTGMGVGLTSIRERVHELGGRSELISSPNGTTVRISVPIA